MRDLEYMKEQWKEHRAKNLLNYDFIWVEKYRPKTIEECILPDDTKKMFQDFLNKGEIPNMLLAGPPGIGKTTVAKALCKSWGRLLCHQWIR